MKIKEVMNEVVAVNKDMSVKEAAKIMTQKGIGSIIFVDGEEISGIITKKDIMTSVDNPTKRITAIMNKNVVTIDQNENLDDAALVMVKNKIKHLPVTEKDKLVGIITATEILAHSEDIDEDFFFE